ncbi:hypothetical protein G7054_g5900 [Neopestalotiopsis clavispora]|nr:hypothetical protein G7054_g5900 [Neopestalotiopsis clavispora]
MLYRRSSNHADLRGTPDLAVSVGFLGATSFEAVLEETQASLNRLGAPTSLVGAGDNHDSDLLLEYPLLIKELCLCVLRAVPHPAAGLRLFPDWVSPEMAWQHRAASFFLHDFYTAWGSYLTSPRSDARLEEMARILCYNTSHDVSDDATQTESWLRQFSGPNMRWESLGLIFYYWVPPGNITQKAREPMDHCIRICRELTTRPTIWLLYLYDRRAALESMYTGDASLSVWRYHAELVSMVTFRGSHADIADTGKKPLMPLELKRRLFWALFITDKITVSFTGRPPFLTRHYVSTPLPLDLKDEDLFADESTFRDAVATKLNTDGWNNEDGFYSSTMLRARAMLSIIKDEILEIVLGPNAASTPSERIIKHCLEEDLLGIVGFGAPAGGILCMELLKPTFTVNRPTQPHLTRSEIIQVLSMLVGFIDRIEPAAPNGRLCIRTKNTIQQVLDYTLNSGFRTSHPIPDIFDWNQENSLFGFNNDLWDSFQWLVPSV